MKVYCLLRDEFRGYRDLRSFNPIVSTNWSTDSQIFPMYDEDTMQIFECGFNAKECLIVAYSEITIEDFRRKIESISEKIIKSAISEAVKNASDSVSALYQEMQLIEVLKTMKRDRG